jgi:acyl-CoA thioester hydrolase
LVEFQNRLKIIYCIYDEHKKEILSKAVSIQVAVKMNNNYMEFETPAIFQNLIKQALKKQQNE